ncbi:MAG: DUF2431 domain-containing protein [Alteromonadaceae bacterium]|nr:DUF2431 domain-containing protein [Alteromonadaceae bacterium]
MYINPAWRILTIGDGDLSFSTSLWNNYKPQHLTATVFDDKQSLTAKYGDEYYQQLVSSGCQVLSGFDVTCQQTWGKLKRNHYDVVIFQFPLIPAFSSVQEFKQQCNNFSINTLNRRLLRLYLLNCFEHFLADNGAKLAFITSKDVKPYRQWNIEDALTLNTNIHFIGKSCFDINQFPGYKIRNVDRDKHVKSTQGTTYVYSTEKNTEINASLGDKIKGCPQDNKSQDKYCSICRTGAFYTDLDKQVHLASKKHLQMQHYEQQWLSYLQHEEHQKDRMG